MSGDPGRAGGDAGGEGDNAVARAGEKLGALRPGYVRLLIDWAALQPDPRQPPDLHARNQGCARALAPCAGYAGVAAEFAALASRQRTTGDGFRAVIVIFGVPRWAAHGRSGCERPGTLAFSRPLTAARGSV